MIKEKLKKQKWFRFVFAWPLILRTRWINGQIARQNIIYEKTVLGGTVVVQPTNFKSQFRVKAISHIAQTVVTRGEYENEVFDAIRAAWRGPGVVVNIGANVGFWAIEIFNIVDGVEKVFAIEPNPEAFELLVENIELNKMDDRIIPIQACVAETEALVTFETIIGKAEYSSIGGIIHPAVQGLTRKSISIQGKPLDKIVDLKASSVRLLIIDTEGADYLVLSGAKEFLKLHKPVIIFECCEPLLNKFGHSVKMMRSMLEELGYESRRVVNLAESVPDGLDGEQALAIPKTQISAFLKN